MADAQNPNPQNQQPQVQVKIDPAIEQGTYSNAVSVHVNAGEIILDFGYIVPNVKPMTVKVLNRVNLSFQTAESFLKVFTNAMLDLRNRQKDAENKK